jgi:2',3'-cyclic-nucleotide 2'-phosphodiesterase (5'-nucleotidase family)
MAEIGYDGMAMGNRESHPCGRILERKLRDARFPVLAANLVGRRQPAPEGVRAHVVFERSGGQVAVIGLAPEMTRPGSWWARVTDYVFEEPVGVANRLARELKEAADLVVCLSHCGEEVDRELAGIAEVDLVLGGHSHRQVVTQEPGRALVVHPGWRGSHVACTELTCREDARSVLRPLEAGR